MILATEIMYWCYVSPEQDWRKESSLEKKLQLCVSNNFKCVIQPAPYFPPARFEISGKVLFKSAYHSASADIEGIELPMPTDGNQVMFSELKVN